MLKWLCLSVLPSTPSCNKVAGCSGLSSSVRLRPPHRFSPDKKLALRMECMQTLRHPACMVDLLAVKANLHDGTG